MKEGTPLHSAVTRQWRYYGGGDNDLNEMMTCQLFAAKHINKG